MDGGTHGGSGVSMPQTKENKPHSHSNHLGDGGGRRREENEWRVERFSTAEHANDDRGRGDDGKGWFVTRWGVVLVGTKLDLREDKQFLSDHPGAAAITSSQNVKVVFDTTPKPKKKLHKRRSYLVL
ncbi:hypothetical protein V6N12_062880 [Hibiscus sabdariffa]|uniref:Uncharacterized protein n=1 Tax=Hibiscus sabdariffa TaxID=183260 RepID=A0ABR2FA44_9ROSI